MQGSYQFLLVLIVAFYAGEVLWRERDAQHRGGDRRDCRCRTGCRCSPKTRRAVRRRVRVHADRRAGRDRLSAVAGYTNLELGLYLRTRAARLGAVRADGVAGGVPAGASATRSSSAMLLFIVVFVLQIVLASRALRAQPVHLRRLADADVLGHERLRPLPAAVGLVPDATGRCSPRCCWCSRRRSGCAARRRRGAAAGARRCASCAVRKVRCSAVLASRSSRSAAGSSTTPTSSTSICRRTSCWIARRASRRSTASTRMLPQPRIADVHADVDIYPGSSGASTIRGHYQLVNKHCRADPRPACLR